jgi:hypothetical protein
VGLGWKQFNEYRFTWAPMGCMFSEIPVSGVHFIVLLYLQTYKARKVNPETMYFCFRVSYFQKYKKTIRASPPDELFFMSTDT